jgi:hypothetical protein
LKQLCSNPPLLDQETFQQLLAAAYTLQEQNRHPRVKETRAEPFASVMVLPPGSEVQPRQHLTAPTQLRARPSNRRMVLRQVSRGNQAFSRAATAVAVAAVLALLLGASVGRLSPIPAGLTLPSEIVEQQPPFQHTTSTVTVPPQNSVDVKTVGIEPDAATNTAPIDHEVVSDQPSEGTHEPSRKTTPNHTRSVYQDEEDVVAQNAAVHYAARTAAGAPSQKKP